MGLTRFIRRFGCDHRGKMSPTSIGTGKLRIRCRHCGKSTTVTVEQWNRDWEVYHEKGVEDGRQDPVSAK